jgi:hypothetical protein
MANSLNPKGLFARIVRPTIVDAAEGLPFSPFECRTDGRSAADWRNNSEMDLFKPDGAGRNLLTTVRSGLEIDLHNLLIETVQLAAPH